MKFKETLFVFLLLFVLTQSYVLSHSEELRLRINAPIDETLAKTLTRVFDEAFQQYLLFLHELDKNVKALGSKRVRDFRYISTENFSLLKGKTLNTVDELRETMTAVSPGFSDAISAGFCAVGDLIYINEKSLITKILNTLDKYLSAHRIAANYFRTPTRIGNRNKTCLIEKEY